MANINESIDDHRFRVGQPVFVQGVIDEVMIRKNGVEYVVRVKGYPVRVAEELVEEVIDGKGV